MKRTIIGIMSLLLCAVLAASCLAGCGKSKSGSKASNSPAGKYVVKTIDGKTPDETIDAMLSEDTESSMTKEEWLKQINVSSPEEIVTIELKDDKTADMNIAVFSLKSKGTWKQDGNKITITREREEDDSDLDDSELTTTFTLNGNELTADEGEPKYVFIKK